MKIKRAKVIQYIVPFVVRLHSVPDRMLQYFAFLARHCIGDLRKTASEDTLKKKKNPASEDVYIVKYHYIW